MKEVIKKREYSSPRSTDFSIDLSAMICQSPGGTVGSGFVGGVGDGESSEE